MAGNSTSTLTAGRFLTWAGSVVPILAISVLAYLANVYGYLIINIFLETIGAVGTLTLQLLGLESELFFVNSLGDVLARFTVTALYITWPLLLPRSVRLTAFATLLLGLAMFPCVVDLECLESSGGFNLHHRSGGFLVAWLAIVFMYLARGVFHRWDSGRLTLVMRGIAFGMLPYVAMVMFMLAFFVILVLMLLYALATDTKVNEPLLLRYLPSITFVLPMVLSAIWLIRSFLVNRPVSRTRL